MVEQRSAAPPAINPETLGERITHLLGRSRFGDHGVRVGVDGTKVTLAGVVRSQRERRMAEAVAWVTRGVTEVENDLAVD